jgi:hypothetical protein
MKERPIIFSAPMVRAILEGRKTQTRRILKPAFGKKHPIENLREHGMTGEDCSGDFNDPMSWGYPCAEDGDDIALGNWPVLCPYGVPAGLDRYGIYGSRLWVRETWAMASRAADVAKIYYQASERDSHTNFHENIPVEKCGKIQPSWPKWKPSIHMPRAFSRINLEITDVRCERLQDISEADAIAEGGEYKDLGQPGAKGWRHGQPWLRDSAKLSFMDLWVSINGGKSWMNNPWVWVIGFKRIP